MRSPCPTGKLSGLIKPVSCIFKSSAFPLAEYDLILP